MVPFGLLRGLTENYDENDLEHVVIPGSRENFLVLLAYIEEENEVRRAGLIRAFRGPDTYHHHTARLGGSLLEDANYFALPSASRAELYRLVNLENHQVLLTRFRLLLAQQSYQTLVSDVKWVIRGQSTELQIEFDKGDQDKARKLSELHTTLRSPGPKDTGISVSQGRLRGTYSVHTIQACLKSAPPLVQR